MTIGTILATPKSVQASGYGQWNLAQLQRKFAKVVVSPQPWSGYWWPYNENGIANSRYDRRGVSSALKLDRALDYGNWIANWEYWNHGTGSFSDDWWGHCNGWATASIMEREPRRPVTVNGIEFAIRDRKAILSEYWMESGSDYIGTRVWDGDDFSSYAFWDVVPADFYLVLTNIVGRQRRSIVFDRYTGVEIWNQPLVAYEIAAVRPEDYLGPDPEYPGLYRVNMTTKIYWAADDVSPDAVTPTFGWKNSDFFESRKLKYELWVDAPLEFDSSGTLLRSGDVVITDSGVGGRWKNGIDPEVLVESHPDFMWLPLSYAPSSGYKNPRMDDGWISRYISEGAAVRGMQP